MTQTILFDIDKTLLDTPRLYRARIVPALCDELGIDTGELERREDEYALTLENSTDFDPEDFLRHISGTDDIDQLAQATIYKPSFFNDALYEDVIPALRQLMSKYRLGIFSQGIKYWQEKKIALTNLTEFFDPSLIFIWLRKTQSEHLSLIPSNSIIVDDNPDVITRLQTMTTLNPIWIDRFNRPSFGQTTTITSLSQLSAVVATLGTNA